MVWAELSGSPSDDVIELLDRLQKDCAASRYAAVISASSEWLDVIQGRAGESTIETLIDASESDRAAALAIACSRAEMGASLSDVASDSSAVRLRQLSDEVSRIATTLARLSGNAGRAPAAGLSTPAPFADPAWDMLLDLLQAEIVQHRVPVSSLCIAAAVPATTALRWITSMTDRGMLVRRDDPYDGRRVFMELAPATSAALRSYFVEVGKLAAI